MHKSLIGITNWGSISALGADSERVWSSYASEASLIQYLPEQGDWGCALLLETKHLLENLQQQNKNYNALDRSVLLALVAASSATSHWQNQENIGINIGSSRGATGLWEVFFQQHAEGKISPLTSPTTTLGNVSSWVAYHLGIQGLTMSHSVTCSTALHAILNGIVWLESGRCERFLAGGSEAPLTDFTIAQMRALRIYAPREASDYPCRALDLQSVSNTMVLGEGAACFALEKNPEQALAWIAGIGYSNEKIQTATSISGEGLEQSMRMALREAGLDSVDVIVCHAPGTRLGDAVEVQAIEQIFGKNIPWLTSNKWKIGHTLGASGALSLEMALLMIQHNRVIEIPYLAASFGKRPKHIETVLVNAAGFGGNTVSIVIKKP